MEKEAKKNQRFVDQFQASDEPGDRARVEGVRSGLGN